MSDIKKPEQVQKATSSSGNKSGQYETEKQYQERIEGGHKLSSLSKAKITADSFKSYKAPVLFVFFILPLILAFLNIVSSHAYFQGITPSHLLQNIASTYADFVLLGFIPEYIFNTVYFVMGAESTYADFWFGVIGKLVAIDAASKIWIVETAYVLFHIVFAYATYHLIFYAMFGSGFWKQPLTPGEKLKATYQSNLAKSKQSLNSDEYIQTAQKKKEDVKKFIKATNESMPISVKIKNKLSSMIPFVKKDQEGYKFRFINYSPVFKHFFTQFDSIRANTLAGELNQRWEQHKKNKQTIDSDEKMLSLLNAGYKYGESERDEVKLDIVKKLPYTFKNDKGEVFNDPKQIFSPGNSVASQKRNMLILLSATSIFKNQILTPIYKHLEANHDIKFNQVERRFISNGRKVFESIDYGQNERFDSYTVYPLPLSLQYDYPFAHGKDISIDIAKSLNDYVSMQQAIIGYVNEIDALLPPYKKEDPAIYQSKLVPFSKLFLQNIERVEDVIFDYLYDRIKYNPASSEKSDDVLSSKIRQVIKQDCIGRLVNIATSNNPKISVFRSREYQELSIAKLKFKEGGNIHVKTNEPINLSAYSLFKNQMVTLGLPQLNHMIDRVYQETNISESLRTSLDQIMGEYDVYASFTHIDKFLFEQSKKLEELR